MFSRIRSALPASHSTEAMCGSTPTVISHASSRLASTSTPATLALRVELATGRRHPDRRGDGPARRGPAAAAAAGRRRDRAARARLLLHEALEHGHVLLGGVERAP